MSVRSTGCVLARAISSKIAGPCAHNLERAGGTRVESSNDFNVRHQDRLPNPQHGCPARRRRSRQMACERSNDGTPQRGAFARSKAGSADRRLCEWNGEGPAPHGDCFALWRSVEAKWLVPADAIPGDVAKDPMNCLIALTFELRDHPCSPHAAGIRCDAGADESRHWARIGQNEAVNCG